MDRQKWPRSQLVNKVSMHFDSYTIVTLLMCNTTLKCNFKLFRSSLTCIHMSGIVSEFTYMQSNAKGWIMWNMTTLISWIRSHCVSCSCSHCEWYTKCLALPKPTQLPAITECRIHIVKAFHFGTLHRNRDQMSSLTPLKTTSPPMRSPSAVLAGFVPHPLLQSAPVPLGLGPQWYLSHCPRHCESRPS